MLVKPGTRVSLKDFDPADTGPFDSSGKAKEEAREEAKEKLGKLISELEALQNLLYAENKRALLIILQGMDAAGKDGTIRKVMSGLNPLGVQVVPFKVPNEEEADHDFLWRIHKAVPRYGNIGIFNRSHYEDVLVVRVHELAPRKVWKTRYEQINQFEKVLVANNVVVLKFFLHISKGEQRKRLEARLHDPTRYWKFSTKDVAERRFWDAYQEAYEDALTKCSTDWAPWHVVPADHKWYRNLVVAEVVVEALRKLDMHYPEPVEDLSKLVIK